MDGDGVGYRLDEAGGVARDEYSEAEEQKSEGGSEYEAEGTCTYYRTQHWQFSSFQIFSNS